MVKIVHGAQWAAFTQMMHNSNKDVLDRMRGNIYSPANKNFTGVIITLIMHTWGEESKWENKRTLFKHNCRQRMN